MVLRGEAIPAIEGVSPDSGTMLSHGEALDLLREGEVEDGQLHPQGSNYTFVVRLLAGERQCLAVYKPRDGEIPLWDFPSGTLYRREVASYHLSEALGWGFVPPTIVRDGPAGEGSMQLYVHHDPAFTYFATRETHVETYKMIAAFDVVANNADRKGGHCLRGSDGNIWGIDHGLTFNVDPKLRTVIWDFAEQRIPKRFMKDIRRVYDELDGGNPSASELHKLLDAEEFAQLRARMEALIEHPFYPPPYSRRSLPWPRT